MFLNARNVMLIHIIRKLYIMPMYSKA